MTASTGAPRVGNPMDEEALRAEATSKSADPRYPAAMRAWLREQLQEVYSRHLPPERVKAVLDEVWPVDG